jgi:hypothetical protein
MAPYLKVLPDLDHLFSINDFLDYATTPEDGLQAIVDRYATVPSDVIFNYTANGKVDDNRYLFASGSEFVFSGFSFVRHGNYINWMLVGGEVLSDDEWAVLAEDASAEHEFVTPQKRLFLETAVRINGPGTGQPLALEGTEKAARKILAGEFDLIAERHLTRCLMSDFEKVLRISSDDPDTEWALRGRKDRDEILANAKEAIDRAGALWNLASTLFLLPHYFEKKVAMVEKRRVPRRPSGLSTSLRSGGFTYVQSIEPALQPRSNAILSYAPREFLLETSGFWRPLTRGSIGRGPHGEPTLGRTWVSGAVAWNEDATTEKTIYVKSSISDAMLKVAAFAAADDASDVPSSTGPSVYVLRCAVMEAGIYKVGWTTGSAEARAKELSSATGVPLAFIVVKFWTHQHSREIEAGVHASLAPYRITDGREFFRADSETIIAAVETEIARVDRAAS